MTREFKHLKAFLVSLSLVSAAGCGDELDPETGDIDALEQADPAVVEVLDGLSVARPEEGSAVTMEILYEDGNTELVTIASDDDGVLSMHHHNDFGLVFEESEEACAARCSDGSYSLMGYHWQSKYSWRYSDANRPGSVGKTAAIDAFKYAFVGIASSRNNCSLADQVSATQEYLGTTSIAPNVTSSGCGQPDGKNIVGWGTLPTGVLGLTCTWSSGGRAVESDQRYNRNVAWFTGNAVPSGCTNQRSLRAVAAHEAGHTFGLGHSGCSQTMAPSLSACKAGTRVYGKGDVLGLRALY